MPKGSVCTSLVGPFGLGFVEKNPRCQGVLVGFGAQTNGFFCEKPKVSRCFDWFLMHKATFFWVIFYGFELVLSLVVV